MRVPRSSAMSAMLGSRDERHRETQRVGRDDAQVAARDVVGDRALGRRDREVGGAIAHGGGGLVHRAQAQVLDLQPVLLEQALVLGDEDREPVEALGATGKAHSGEVSCHRVVLQFFGVGWSVSGLVRSVARRAAGRPGGRCPRRRHAASARQARARRCSAWCRRSRARLGIDGAYRAEQLGAEQDVARVDHARRAGRSRLVVDAGVEEQVLHQVLGQRRLAEHDRQPR